MKKLIKAFLVISFIIFFTTAPALAVEQYDYVTYYMLTSESITVAWDNDNTGTVIFDLHIKRVEWDEVVVEHTGIEDTMYTITVPKAGLYIIMVRARRALTSAETISVNAMDRPALLQIIQDYNISDLVGDTTNLTDQEIKNAIILVGRSSTWSDSITHGQVGGVDKSWWIYGYIEKPGPIVITNAIKHYIHTKKI